MNVSTELELESCSEYHLYADELSDLLLASQRCEQEVQKHLVSEASLAVERLVPQVERSKHGIFFTPDSIVEFLVSRIESQIDAGESFFDPACGAGNLLVGIASRSSLGANLDETINIWSQRFGGCDLNGSFVKVAKLRLIFLAAYRHGLPELSESYLAHLLGKFSYFFVGDYLKSRHGGDFDCIIANPPFAHVEVDKACGWSSGRTQLAAIFISSVIDRARPGQKVTAVLPDVLRSGTRYGRWRRHIERSSLGGQSILLGRFAADVDVDVFVLSFSISSNVVSESLIQWIPNRPLGNGRVKLEDFYDVCVGPVVPFRLTGKGNFSPYITAKNCPPYGEINRAGKIRFEGRKIEPPFVVVRRTSNPADKNRLVTTLVNCSEPVAVENHLIVMRPKDGQVSSCRRLICKLGASDCISQINEKIRCRHLTVRSIKDLEI